MSSLVGGPSTEYARNGDGLQEIPQEVVSKNWSKFDFSSNALRVLPYQLFLGNQLLTSLSLSNNKLVSIPEEIRVLRGLQLLDVSHNELSSLPSALWSNSSLLQLLLAHNHLTRLDRRVGQLTQLQVLDVSHNQLAAIPPEVGQLPLEQINVEGNKLRMRPSVIRGGTAAVLQYLQVICTQHQMVDQHLYEYSRQLSPDTSTHAAASKKAPGARAAAEEEPVPTDPAALAALVEARLRAAAADGIVDLHRIASPAALLQLPRQPTAVAVVDVRSSALAELPPAVLSLPGLVVLNAADNCIEELPGGVVPEALGILNLSFNNLSSLPEALGRAPSLQQLYVANNNLTTLPSSFAQLPMVDLFLSENRFSTIPKAVFGMTQLTKLSIACCRLNEVSDAIGALASLLFLDLSFNELPTLPDSLTQLSSLTALSVSFNPLTKFPAVIPRMTSLQELNLDHCRISDLPASIGDLRALRGLQLEGLPLPSPLDVIYAANPLQLLQLHDTALTSLDLSGLGMPTFPKQLSRLTGLHTLNLAGNKLEGCPEELGLLSSLTQLDLSGNPLREPFAKLAELRGATALIALCSRAAPSLDLGGCGLESLPDEVRIHAQLLHKLKLPDNRLTGLPDWLASFDTLHTAMLDNNQLTELPQVLLSLPKICVISASNNFIAQLPDSLADCSCLQALVLKHNVLTSVPGTIGGLKNLQLLDLSTNRLSGRLSSAVCGCTALAVLKLSGNALTALPRSLGQLLRLQVLRADGNMLRSLPPDLAQLASLTEVSFANNAFELSDPSVELKARDAQGVQRVLKLLQLHCSSSGHLEPGSPRRPSAMQAEGRRHSPLPAADAGPQTEDKVRQVQDEAQQPPPTTDSMKAQEASSSGADQDAKSLSLQRHLALVKQDPLRAKHCSWDALPLMRVPGIISAISNPPPVPPAPDPGPAAGGAAAKAARPQSLRRFKRLADQGAVAMQLLNRVSDALNAQAAPAPPPPPAQPHPAPPAPTSRPNAASSSSPLPPAPYPMGPMPAGFYYYPGPGQLPLRPGHLGQPHSHSMSFTAGPPMMPLAAAAAPQPKSKSFTAQPRRGPGLPDPSQASFFYASPGAFPLPPPNPAGAPFPPQGQPGQPPGMAMAYYIFPQGVPMQGGFTQGGFAQDAFPVSKPASVPLRVGTGTRIR